VKDYHRFNGMKLLAYADRLKQVRAGEWPYPIDWHVYPSNVCNHSCSWCMFRQNGEQESHPVKLSRSALMRAVTDASTTGAVFMEFSGGGEPLLNSATPAAMEYAQAQGLAVGLTTNGRYLTPDLLAIASTVRVSLNAGTEATHARVNHAGRHERSDWDRIVANLDACRASPHRARCDFGLAFVVDHHNWEDVGPFCALAASLEVDYVQIRPAFWYDAAEDVAAREVMQAVLMEVERATQNNTGLAIHATLEKFDGYWTPRTYDKCWAVQTGIVLTATGDFAVCQDRTDLRFGQNYAQGAPFSATWGSPEHRALVAQIVAGAALDACPRCVWNKRNEIIEHVLGPDDPMRLTLV
jgi:wyosine [tRNA(Phe)-imidazoG37] synthetase (radical SAM superfamily)